MMGGWSGFSGLGAFGQYGQQPAAVAHFGPALQQAAVAQRAIQPPVVQQMAQQTSLANHGYIL